MDIFSLRFVLTFATKAKFLYAERVLWLMLRPSLLKVQPWTKYCRQNQQYK